MIYYLRHLVISTNKKRCLDIILITTHKWTGSVYCCPKLLFVGKMARNLLHYLRNYTPFYGEDMTDDEVVEWESQVPQFQYKARVAALWKRVAAQLIDIVFLYILKHSPYVLFNRNVCLEDYLNYIATWSLVDYCKWAEGMAYHVFYIEAIFIFLTSLNKIWFPTGFSKLQDITIGKMVFNLRVERIDNIHPTLRTHFTESDIMEVNHINDIGFFQAILRSYLKIVFKLYFSFYVPKISKINRSSYDIMFRTIVVQEIYEDELPESFYEKKTRRAISNKKEE